MLVRNRLMPGLHIDDAEAAHREADILLDEETFIVGPAMRDAAVHARKHVALDAPVAIRKKDSTNSTHKISAHTVFTGTREPFNHAFQTSLSTMTASASLEITLTGSTPVSSQRKIRDLAAIILRLSQSTKLALQQTKVTGTPSVARFRYRNSASVLHESSFQGDPSLKKKQCSS